MTGHRFLIAAALLAAAPFLAPLPAFAQADTQTKLGDFGDWEAYTAVRGGAKVCYVLSKPKDRQPSGLNRDPAFFFISHRPSENVRNESSMIAGFPLKKDAESTVQIGSTNFSMYTENDGAWVRRDDQAKFVEALRKGAEMSIKSTSQRGNVTTDKYSLKGISAALDKVAAECK